MNLDRERLCGGRSVCNLIKIKGRIMCTSFQFQNAQADNLPLAKITSLTRISGIAMSVTVISLPAHSSEIYWRDNKLISTAPLIIIECARLSHLHLKIAHTHTSFQLMIFFLTEI